MDLDKLEQLEQCVERLVDQCQRMQQARDRAETRLHERDTEFKGLNEQIRRYERERAVLKEGLTKIIGRFDRLDLS